MITLHREHQRISRFLPLKDIEHFRVQEEYSPVGGKTHIGVVVLTTGACFVSRVREPKHKYVRKIWYTKSVGQALRKASDKHMFIGADFSVDNELEGRDLYRAVKAELQKRGWLPE